MTVLALAAVAIAYAFQSSGAPAAAPAAAAASAGASVTFTSEPAGATVLIGGISRGVTPLKLQLPAGQHEAELTLGASNKRLPFALESNTVMAQHVEFASPAAAADTGRLEVTTDPPGARVSIDGTPRGTTPLSVPSIAVGDHRITISVDQTSVNRSVTVAPGATATVMVALASSGNAGGWAQIESPIELQVYEAGQLIGTTTASRLMLPAGRHDLEVANAALEFRAPVRVDIQPGRTLTVPVAIPNGSLSISALPWAEVLVDERPAGTTPLGNLSVPIGTHEITWRHPQLGERTRTVSVPVRTAVRVGVDFSR